MITGFGITVGTRMLVCEAEDGTMAHEEQLAILKGGVQDWHEWKITNPDQQIDLSDANFSGSDLTSVDLRGAILHGTDFSDANLSRANLNEADLSKAILMDANLSNAILADANLRSAVLSRANLTHANLSHANLSRADLSDADLSHAELSHADLIRADLTHANLDSANLSHADLSHVILVDANLCHEDLSRANLCGAVLNRADLSHADLNHADLNGANLRGAVLRGSDLSDTCLSRANLSRTDLTDANLSHALLDAATLANANLSRAIMIGANLASTNLKGSNFKDVILSRTVFCGVDLRRIRGLKSANHIGPSYVDIDTLYNSRGDIPGVFLKGVGMPDKFIRYSSDLVSQGAEMSSCFISYGHEDRLFALKLHDALQERGIRCWLDEKQSSPSDNVHPLFDRGIRAGGKVFLCCSEHSLMSWWVDQEISAALGEEEKLWRERQEQSWVLIPLNLDGYLDDTWQSRYKAQIMQRLVVDFSDWEHRDVHFEEQVETAIRMLQMSADDGVDDTAEKP